MKTFSMTAAAPIAPSVLVRRKHSSTPGTTSDRPANIRYCHEAPRKVHASFIGEEAPYVSASVVGEGGGLLILEEYEHAKARGAKIYAEVVGFGASQDSYSVTEPDPSGHSYAAAITRALAEAKLSAAEVDLLVPFGLGIRGHDAAELAGLKSRKIT